MKALPRHIHTLLLLHFHPCSCLSCRDCLAPAILMCLISAAAATWQAWRASRAALPLPCRCVASHALPALVAWSARPPPPPLSLCPLRRMRVARARSSLGLSRLHRCPFPPSYAPQAAAASDGGDVAGMEGEQGGAAVAAQVRRLACAACFGCMERTPTTTTPLPLPPPPHACCTSAQQPGPQPAAPLPLPPLLCTAGCCCQRWQ